jgi:hypothetical protein
LRGEALEEAWSENERAARGSFPGESSCEVTRLAPNRSSDDESVLPQAKGTN